TIDLTVTPTPGTPVVTANSTTLCEGEDLQLSANATDATDYNWTGPDGFSSTIQNPFINNISLNQAGTYTLIATALNCSSPAATIDITVNATPVATALISNPLRCSGNALR
ncbi:MAG: immunoglobulin domain-containing protein, partial [Bacteroidia bacterium]